jgi:hypothetical protein
MRMLIREEGGPEAAGERTFAEPVLWVERDGSACQLVFNGSRWPMVFRRHAEFSPAGGRGLLLDLGSALGTLVDGRRISGPTEIRVGSRVQFGADGPVVRILRIEGIEAAQPSCGVQTARSAVPEPVGDAAEQSKNWWLTPSAAMVAFLFYRLLRDFKFNLPWPW